MFKRKVNKKVINATPCIYNGIEFKSKTEGKVYKVLVSEGFKVKYEPDTITLLDKFKPTKSWYLDGLPQITKSGVPLTQHGWTYTPDFRIDYNNTIIYIEVKGKPNDVYPYKRKMFLKYIEKFKNIYFFEVHTLKGLQKTIDIIKNL